MANEVEVVVTSTDKSAAGLSSADQKIEEFRKSAIKKIEDINAREIKLKADITQAENNLGRLQALSETIERDTQMKVDADVRAAETQLDKLRQKAQGLEGDEKIRIDADISAAEAKLARLKETAKTAAAEAKLKVDADTALAQQKVQELRRQLESLPAAKAKVDADTAAGIEKIRQVQREADQATRSKSMTIIVDTSRGIAAVTALVAAISALGPVALAAVGAMSGIGAVTALGFGTAMSGFSGIGDAMKAMETSAKSSGGAVADNSAAVRSATQGVVEARRQLAAANENVELAEADLSRSQDEARQVQETLNDARQDAIRMLEDYQLRSEDMALSQRSAALSVQEAEKRLADLRKGGKADALELARAELNVEEARQRQKQLTVDATRLAQDKAKADAAGVEGSRQVVDANARIADANRAVESAERSLRNAKLDQVRATENLVESQRKLQEAMKPQGGGGTAVDKLAEAMAKLTPQGREFAKFLYDFVNGPWKQLKDEGQANFLPGIQSGLQRLIPIIQENKASFGEFSRTLGQALGDLIPIVGQLAGPFLDFANASLRGLQPLQPLLQGLANDLGTVLERLAASGQAEAAMSGLVQVLTPIVEIIPKVVELGTQMMAAMGPSLGQVVKNLADTLMILLQAFVQCAPAAGQMLTAVSGILPVIAQLVAALATLNPNVTATVLALAGAVMAFQRISTAVSSVRTVVSGLGSVFGRTAVDIDGTERSMTRGEVATKRLALAYSAAAVASAAMSSGASTNINTTIKDMEALAATGDKTGESFKNLEWDLKSVDSGGIGRRLADTGEQLFLVSGVLDRSIQNTDARIRAMDSALAQMAQNGAADQAAAAFQKLADEGAKYGTTVEELKARFPQYAEALNQIAKANQDAADATNAHNRAVEQTAETVLGLRGSETAYYESLQQAKEALQQNGATLDVHTAAGRANRQALDDMARSSNAYLQSIVENEGAGPRFASTLAESRAALSQTAQQMGMSKQKADELAAAVIAIPNQKTILVQANTAAAIAALNKVQTTITSINDKTVTIRVNQVGGSISGPEGTKFFKSRGGRVAGAPSMVDTEPHMLARGEFVVRSDVTSRWLPFLEAINSGASPTPTGSGGGVSGGIPTGGASGGGTVVLELSSSGSAIDDFLVELLRRAVRVRGGDVQVVLGQGAAA